MVAKFAEALWRLNDGWILEIVRNAVQISLGDSQIILCFGLLFAMAVLQTEL